ncbi:DUF4384 domain-containing protein [Candidatus Sumerlaeota bacterium]|nr:DUF4384 domain-containing protein [Candidatus Sumerlaeota bacterium]
MRNHLYPILTALVLVALPLVPAQSPQTQAIVVTPTPVYPQPNPPYDPGWGALGVDVWTDSHTYYIGDSVDVQFRVSQDAYVYIFNTDARGVTTQIFPNYFDQDNYVRGDRTYRLPRRGYEFTAAGPAGRETIEIYAVTSNANFGDVFTRWDSSTPYPLLSDQGRRTLNSIQVAPVPGPSTNRIIVTPQPQPVYGHAQDTAFIDILDPYYPPVGYGGDLVIRSSVDHVTVYIDGQFVGYAPGTFRGVAPGYHDVELYRPGYRTQVQRVHIQAGRTTYLQARMSRGIDRQPWARNDVDRDHGWVSAEVGDGFSVGFRWISGR